MMSDPYTGEPLDNSTAIMKAMQRTRAAAARIRTMDRNDPRLKDLLLQIDRLAQLNMKTPA